MTVEKEVGVKLNGSRTSFEGTRVEVGSPQDPFHGGMSHVLPLRKQISIDFPVRFCTFSWYFLAPFFSFQSYVRKYFTLPPIRFDED